MSRKTERNTIETSMWNLLTELRGQIDGWDFKNYSLTMIFYKFLCENFENDINDNEYNAGNFSFDYSEISDETAEKIRPTMLGRLGYFIKPSELFCNIQKNADTDANLNITIKSAFNHTQESSIGTIAQDSIKGIFDDFDTSSSKLGSSVTAKNAVLAKLINCIATINFDSTHAGLKSDAFGDMYEYLMGMYAQNAGKSGGEYFTPPEVSILLARIVSIGKKEVKNVYDPACGSGSLLLKFVKTIGLENIRDGIYGQELNTTTYNLCRENMMLHNVSGDKINIENGDTLASPQHLSKQFEIICSNPPYSIHWDVTPTTILDNRFAPAGATAPSSKADYAFLQHIIYHLTTNGVAGVVLPHGVLFRGGSEGTIREYFIDNNYIDTIIGLPSNIFYGTGIPTIIMVLKKERTNSDILFIDASKCFEKDKNQNMLRDSDIERIYDAVVARKDIKGFAKVINKSEVIKNEYNLNIPRYISTDETSEVNDLYSLMTGKISSSEIDIFNPYWDILEGLKDKLFEVDKEYKDFYIFKNINIKDTINKDISVENFNKKNIKLLNKFNKYLHKTLIDNMNSVTTDTYKSIKKKLFELFEKEELIDIYNIFQILSDNYDIAFSDIIAINKNGLEYCNKSIPNIIQKKIDKKLTNVQDGMCGAIIPFDLVKSYYLSDEYDEIDKLQKKANEQSSIYTEILESLDEDIKIEVCKLTKDGKLPEDEISFNTAKLKKYIKSNNNEELKKAQEAIDLEKSLQKQIKEKTDALDEKAESKLNTLNNEEIKDLLGKKWIDPIISEIESSMNSIIEDFIKKLEELKNKYSSQLSSINEEIKETEEELIKMFDNLTGSETDLKAIEILKDLLKS